MNSKCVYFHYRNDTGEVFYVGMGNEERPYLKKGRNKHWHNVVNKHGYTVDVISSNLSLEDAHFLEESFISMFGKKLNGGQLVNLADGGQGGSGSRRGVKHTKETRKKMSEAKKGCIPWNKGTKGLQVSWNKGLKCPRTKFVFDLDGVLYRSKRECMREYMSNGMTRSKWIAEIDPKLKRI